MASFLWPNMSGMGGATVSIPVSGTTTISVQTSSAIVIANTSTGGYTITLPDAVSNAGYPITIKNFGTPTHLLTINTQGGQSIDQYTTDELSQDDQSATYYPSGGEWYRG